ncbi:MAG: hypothetical protein AUI14_00605 [Actinobacteria bacterium 13_2_20CM_2_71_6]|nr:MAG: hypothetical protein AUI14_00605 [Actinobacteria bacterium 13_2_20CM_2_71_6]
MGRSIDLPSEPGGDAPQDPTIIRRTHRSQFRLSLAWRRLKVYLGFRTNERVQEGLTFLLLCVSAAIFGGGVIAVGAFTNASFWPILIGFVLVSGSVLAAGMTFIKRRLP